MTNTAIANRRPVTLRRSWVFIAGVRINSPDAVYQCAADALIVDLEDSTPPHLRPQARAELAEYVRRCRGAGKVACVRINPLHGDGLEDLRAVLPAAPDAILLPKTESAAQVLELAERSAQVPHIELVPNLETAAGLVRAQEIITAHPRVSASLLASEDLTTSLGAERGRDGTELQYARARFLLECRAAGVVAIDCPYTFSDMEGLEQETRHARRLGYGAKSAVDIGQAALINRILSPSDDEVARARHIVSAFEGAHARGERAQVDGNYLEVPIYLNAKRLLERREGFDAMMKSSTS